MIDIVNPFDARPVSPSFANEGGRRNLLPAAPLWESHRPEGAFELKFLVDDQKAKAIREWARERLQPDPYATTEDPRSAVTLADGYRVQSLYLDTPQLDIFHRIPAMQGAKYRLRRYGNEKIVWLERKQKTEGIVRKQRVAITDDELLLRLRGDIEDSWDGSWFRSQVDDLSLRPTCHVTYQRFARIGATSGGLVRLTLDSQVGGGQADEWAVPRGFLTSPDLLAGRSILELKFKDVVPTLFKELMQDFQLSTGRFSKYRETVRRFLTTGPDSNGAPGKGRNDA